MNTLSNRVVAVMFAARVALAALLLFSPACSGNVEVDGTIEVCPDEPDAGTVTTPPAPACIVCAELVITGGDARNVCDADTSAYYEVWECVIDAPQCMPCPHWPDYPIFDPTPLDPLCLECLVFEGCGAELNACGVKVPL